ncbi:MAG: hypothetical protein M5R36_15390 [Deltaproteobacteria bacterium]|nr:hypothetical protein [Deltaproteobacteria bacterium]
MAGSVGRQHSEGGGVEIDLIRYTMGPHFGLVVIDRGTLRFYPVVALGWAGLSGDVDAPSDARDAALDREDGGNGTGMIFGRNADLEYGAFTAGVALYLDYLFPIYRHEMGLAFVFTGARLGANFEAVSTGWEANGGDWPGDDPDFRYDHGFLRLAFGFGAGSPTKTVMDMHDKMHGGMHGGHEGHE